jgi:uncharacterized damage-inducible protein DinB
MNLSTQIAKQLRAVYFGGNWTSVNMKEVLSDIGWQEATEEIFSFNTIAVLVFHTGYYIGAVMQVLEGGQLTAKDSYSFELPPVQSAEAWENLVLKTLSDAERFADRIEQLPENKLHETFVDEKYGTYYRNLTGIIEHTHYHLGQIVVIKKLLRARTH